MCTALAILLFVLIAVTVVVTFNGVKRPHTFSASGEDSSRGIADSIVFVRAPYGSGDSVLKKCPNRPVWMTGIIQNRAAQHRE
jgi:hypothetical protein